jgi:hypothetical protein
MVFLYGMLRSLISALRQMAAWKHARSQRIYERLQKAFSEAERDCKAHEVRVGRPVDYKSQLRLLKSYEASEAARGKWMRAAQKLGAWKAREAKVRAFSGKKLPYSFGLVDMALLLNVLDYLGTPFRVDFAMLAELVRSRL